MGILLLPFYQVVLALLPHKTLSFEDTRSDKLVLSLSIALIFAIVTFYQGIPKRFPNKWILAFIAFTFINIFICPSYHFKIGSMDLAGFWNYKPLVKIFVYFLFGWAVYSQEWEPKDIQFILKCMFWCGFGMACYVLIQHFGLDQFYGIRADNPDLLELPKKHIGGTLGHSTLVAPYIAMLIPLGFYLRKYIYSCLMILAVCLTYSKVAIVAMIIGLLFYVALQKSVFMKVFICLILVTSVTSGVIYFKDKTVLGRLGSSGRFGIWTQIVKDLKEPPFDGATQIFPLTGKGIGSYGYVFVPRYKTRFHEAHNEYLQTLHDGGIIGMGLLLLAVGSLLLASSRAFLGVSDGSALTSSFLIIALCAGGTFIWQLGIYQYYSCIIVGLLMRRDL